MHAPQIQDPVIGAILLLSREDVRRRLRSVIVQGKRSLIDQPPLKMPIMACAEQGTRIGLGQIFKLRALSTYDWLFQLYDVPEHVSLTP